MIKVFILRIRQGAKLNSVKEASFIGYSKKLWTDKHKEMEEKSYDNYKRVWKPISSWKIPNNPPYQRNDSHLVESLTVGSSFKWASQKGPGESVGERILVLALWRTSSSAGLQAQHRQHRQPTDKVVWKSCGVQEVVIPHGRKGLRVGRDAENFKSLEKGLSKYVHGKWQGISNLVLYSFAR